MSNSQISYLKIISIRIKQSEYCVEFKINDRRLSAVAD